MLVVQQFVKVERVVCRACGGRLLRGFTLRTLVQGWWGYVSFFVNWFVLAANARAWLRLRVLPQPFLSGTDGQVSPADAPLHGLDEEPGSRRSRVGRRLGVSVAAGLVLLGVLGWAWDARHHDHDGDHGPGLTARALEAEATGGPFTAEDGAPIAIQAADCSGEGEPTAGQRFTHLRCTLSFANGDTDEVVVHVLPNELFFKSAEGT